MNIDSFKTEPLCYTKGILIRPVLKYIHFMRKDKVRAYKLRREGKSYKEIKAALGIPLGTIASWFKDQDWSQKIRDELGAQKSLSVPSRLEAVKKASKIRWAKNYESYRALAKTEFTAKKTNPLFMAGVMLYWGEGNKSTEGSQVKFSNNDPLMIRVFYRFLTEELGLTPDKISVYLLLYPDLQDKMLKNFWSKSVGIPLERFWASVFIKGKQPARRLSYGVCNVCVSSRELKERMLTWIDLYQKQLA